MEPRLAACGHCHTKKPCQQQQVYNIATEQWPTFWTAFWCGIVALSGAERHCLSKSKAHITPINASFGVRWHRVKIQWHWSALNGTIGCLMVLWRWMTWCGAGQ